MMHSETPAPRRAWTTPTVTDLDASSDDVAASFAPVTDGIFQATS